MEDNLLQLLGHISVRTLGSLRRSHDTVEVGPFLASFHPASDMVWLNYAVPDALAANAVASMTLAVVQELRRQFRRRARTLRFEFFESLWPGLPSLLDRCGLKLQGRMPVMLCSPADLRQVRAEGIELRSLTHHDDDATFARFLATAKRAFSMESAEVSTEEIADQRRNLANGIHKSAFAFLDGKLAGVGTIAIVNDELVGIGTLPEFRRRHVAASLSSFLVALHFANGAPLAWLSAADPPATALYEKIGFRHAGAQMNYIDVPIES